jgi:hypothetical protein
MAKHDIQEVPDAPAPGPPQERVKPASKRSAVIALMSRDGGASVEQMMAATGWLHHSTRAVLTGLKKKGHIISKEKKDGTTFYMIKGAA